MQVIPVLDLLGGTVVRAIAGQRQQYQPVTSCLCNSSEPAVVAAAFCEKLGLELFYLADLDALAGGEPAWETYRTLTESGGRLWIDAGIRHAGQARRLASIAVELPGWERMVLGLETLAGPEQLSSIAETLDPESLVFSLDLKDGQPLTASPSWSSSKPVDIAKLAVAAGIRRIIVLDLKQVGTGSGPATEDLCRQILASCPEVELIAGGGIRGREDLQHLEQIGCRAALVASALHDGRLVPGDWECGENSGLTGNGT